ncbi:MAG: hypothetical protein NTU79_11560 [Planctomycetota bacterium]|nr:hypothetical protein [Planctomycetota bacterium]
MTAVPSAYVPRMTTQYLFLYVLSGCVSESPHVGLAQNVEHIIVRRQSKMPMALGSFSM